MSERVAIVGSRDYEDLWRVWDYVRDLPEGTVIISGGARGVDLAAECAAELWGIEVEVIRPDYARHPGKVAPLIRNGEIAARCDRMVAFHDGASRGTADAIARARALGKPVEVIGP